MPKNNAPQNDWKMSCRSRVNRKGKRKKNACGPALFRIFVSHAGGVRLEVKDGLTLVRAGQVELPAFRLFFGVKDRVAELVVSLVWVIGAAGRCRTEPRCCFLCVAGGGGRRGAVRV